MLGTEALRALTAGAADALCAEVLALDLSRLQPSHDFQVQVEHLQLS